MNAERYPSKTDGGGNVPLSRPKFRLVSRTDRGGWRPGHEQIDDSLRLRRKMRRARRERIARRGRRMAAILAKQRRKRHAAQADAAVAKKPAPGDLAIFDLLRDLSSMALHRELSRTSLSISRCLCRRQPLVKGLIQIQQHACDDRPRRRVGRADAFGQIRELLVVAGGDGSRRNPAVGQSLAAAIDRATRFRRFLQPSDDRFVQSLNA